MKSVGYGTILALSLFFVSVNISANEESIWFAPSGKLSERALGLYTALELAEHNLIATDDLRALLDAAKTLDQIDRAHFSVLDDLIKRFSMGQVEPSVDPLWHYPLPMIDLLQARTEILSSPTFLSALSNRLPQHPDYKALVEAYSEQADLDTDEPPKIEFVGYLKQGITHQTIAQVRERLTWLGYPVTDAVSVMVPSLYDLQLAEQVRHFQHDHGLDEDEVIGPDTIRWLNFSAADRRAIIAAVLERWRWLPRNLGSEYILVSIPGFEVQYFSEGLLKQRYTSITGRPARPTHSFTAQIEQLVVNPDWTVPRRILMRDLVPKINANPDYLKSQKMQAQRLINGGWQDVENNSIAWDQLSWDDRDIRLVQTPGEHNALGQIKFHMPNEYAIYLHDTPSKNLFDEVSRAYSSGCVRVKGVADLARILMHERSELLEQSLLQKNTQWVRLPKPVPAYLVYHRAWVDSDGRLQLRDDIYHSDRVLSRALAGMMKNAHLAQR